MHDNDLDWLARNVHKWRDGAGFIFGGYNNWGFVSLGHDRDCSGCFSREQWLARRAELQNKPVWELAPEWAEWLSQDSGGAWWFFRLKPAVYGGVCDSDNTSFHHPSWMIGEVLGDWRNTLERRPEPAKQFASIEDIQEIGVINQNNDWFERGELPPIGEVCEFNPGNGADNFSDDELKASGHSVQIVAHTKYNLSTGNVAVFKWDFYGCCGVSTGAASCFRPLPTERDKAISEMVAIMKGETAGLVLFGDAAAKLYDAGYRKASK